MYFFIKYILFIGTNLKMISHNNFWEIDEFVDKVNSSNINKQRFFQ